jgi:hypothetical protein
MVRSLLELMPKTLRDDEFRVPDRLMSAFVSLAFNTTVDFQFKANVRTWHEPADFRGAAIPSAMLG